MLYSYISIFCARTTCKNSRLFINISLFLSSHLILQISTWKVRTHIRTLIIYNQKDLSFDQSTRSEEEALTLAGYRRRTDELYSQDSANQKKLSGTTAFRRSTFDTGWSLRRSATAGPHPDRPRIAPTWPSAAAVVQSKYRRRLRHGHNWSLFKILHSIRLLQEITSLLGTSRIPSA